MTEFPNSFDGELTHADLTTGSRTSEHGGPLSRSIQRALGVTWPVRVNAEGITIASDDAAARYGHTPRTKQLLARMASGLSGLPFHYRLELRGVLEREVSS
jgi:hypothetical protein